ncbi:DNA polymerase III subunit gamma/tau [Shewanella canadensis]|uniref:DNA-directed DNA polymerase n=1 Tax=Shewanella canadensis TaxID=271096 RepID=A0A3S0INV3_9GAMM|nr:DNA polymerase III subunit gamma/tau [Shewanella canadensis]RTR39435.1 DNA polymerase III subunit gamma/tau [Shewanella canadensis]
MSYQVLARKWRPATFEQMVGQSHVLHALTNALSQQRLHHAYLFSGTRGVGKTSLARLFAKGLNCEKGVTASPCGQCSSCTEISEGRFVDLIEVDAASRTKVDDTRELLDNVQYRPSRGRYKVYLIDEVHMLSRSSFNALLKTLEEPPEHVKFLLATTDPQRLPVTVLSRCLQFNLKSLTLSEIEQQLTHVLSQEQLSFEPQALKLLAKSANGSMRDALSLTDQAIAFGAGQVKLTQVQTMLGSIDEHHVITLLNALIQGDIENLMQVTAKVLSFGADPQEVLRSLLELLHQITLSQFAPAAAQLSIYSEQITAFAEQISPEQIQLYYQLLLTGRKDLPHAPDPKSGLEMALLRAVTFVPEVPVKRWLVANPATISIPEAKPASQLEHGDVNTSSSQSQRLDCPTVEPTSKPPVPDRQSVVQASSVGVSPVKPPVTADMNEQRPESVTSVDEDDISGESLDDSNLLNSLNSEQALILSQASSHGMEQAVALVSPPEAATAQDLASEAPNSIETQAVEVEPSANTVHNGIESQPQLVESSVADSQSDITRRTESQLAPESMPEPSVPEPNTPEQGVTSPDSMPDEYYAAQAAQLDAQTDAYDDQPQQMDEYLPFDSLAQGSPGTSDSELNRGNNGAVTSPVSDAAEDDILDAVLAARDSLLTELVESEPKESGGKKPKAERQGFVPPTRKPALRDPEKQNSVDNGLHDLSDQLETLESEVTESQIEDLPPWEEQESAVSLNDDSKVETETPDKPDKLHYDAATGEGSHLDQVGGTQKQTQSQTQTQSDTSTAASNSSESQVCVEQMPAQVVVSGDGEITGHDIDLKWYRLMSALDVGGRVRQLAVNSVCHEFISPIPLLLKPNQKHLAADIAIVQLEEALSRALGNETKVAIEVGVDDVHETPLEIRQRFHRELLAQAQQGLMSDSNIQWLMSQMDAEFENDSLSYNPELLSLKGNTIELIDKSNFKTLTES